MQVILDNIEYTTKIIGVITAIATLLGIPKFFEQSIRHVLSRLFVSIVVGATIGIAACFIFKVQEDRMNTVISGVVATLSIGVFSFLFEEFTKVSSSKVSGALSGIFILLIFYFVNKWNLSNELLLPLLFAALVGGAISYLIHAFEY